MHLTARFSRPIQQVFVATIGLALFLLAYLVGTVLAPLAHQTRPDASESLPVPSAVDAAAISGTDRTIGALQERLRTRPDDLTAQSQLGMAYLQKARETADPAFYARAEHLLAQVHAQYPQHTDALIGLGALALARHEFVRAHEWGLLAVEANPDRAATHGLLADALIELGRYEQAVDSVQRMVDTRPDQAAYARVAYLRELHGDVPGAIEAMRYAVESGVPGREPTEWARTQLGHLYFHAGDLDTAEVAYRQALDLYPGYVHATTGLARVLAARGDFEQAIALYSDVMQRAPGPETAIALYDVYAASGRHDEATRQREVVLAMQQLFAANGVRPDLAPALFQTDVEGDPASAIEQIRATWDEGRQSVYVADALGWALYRAGRCEEASTFAQAALRLGTRDASMLYHASQVAACQGDSARAETLLREALETNPYFSLRHAPAAAAAIAPASPGQTP